MTFYNRVSKLCTKEGITVNGLIVKLGMSKSNGKSWREGAVPQAATLKKIADYFGVDPEYLLNGSTNNSGDIADNHGVIGNAAPISPDDGMLQTLCGIYQKLDAISKARLLLYANDLL